MTTFISSISTCVSRQNHGVLALENRARRGDILLNLHPDRLEVVNPGPLPLGVTLPGVGHVPAPGEDEKEAAWVFYVAATRATHKLLIGAGANGAFGRMLQ